MVTQVPSRVPTQPWAIPDLSLKSGPYRARFARHRSEIEAAQRLRFQVFNLELGEGLTLTLHFDGERTTVTDYLATYRQDGAFRPFFVQREGKRFVTAPEDGSAFELLDGDRLVVDTSVYVLRQE